MTRRHSLRTIDEAEPSGEGGLLGLAVTPDERQVFAYYTAAEDNRIVAMSLDGRTLGEPKVILDGIPKGQIHNGGRMVVGPDGHLYVGTGDSAESPAGPGPRIAGRQDPADHRWTASRRRGTRSATRCSAWGTATSQGLAFDEQDRLWACEFGSQSWDELNLIGEGNNYGWPLVEGSGEGDGLTNPKVVWET